MATEYSVIYRRKGMHSKRVVYKHRGSADRRLALLTHPRPWEPLDQNPDAYVCCDGYECGCRGVTVREDHEDIRKRLPPLEYVRLESREVGEWRPELADG
jgi:hypothetical protein